MGALTSIRVHWASAALAATLGLAVARMPPPAVAATPLPTVEPIMLAPAIVPPAPAADARGVFYRASARATLPAGLALLAGSADGRGELCTDDEARITFRAAGAEEQVWAHRFADESLGAVVCLPPQTIRLNAGGGAYTVELVLADRYPPVYGSSPYILIPLAPTAAPAVTASTAAPVAPAPVSAPAIVAASAVPATTAVATPSTARPAPGALPAESHEASVAAPGGIMARWGVPTLLLAAALLALLALALSRRPRRRPALGGVLDMLDRDTGERRTALLAPFPTGAALARHPLELRRPGDRLDDERVFAMLAPTRAGPELHVLQPGAATLTYQLRPGERLLVAGALELRYRNA